MKKIIFLFFSFSISLTFSQTNTFPPDGNVGIGTLNPNYYGHGGTNRIIEINNPNNSQNSQSHLMLTSNTLSANSSIGTVTWYVPSTSWRNAAWIGGLTEQDNQHVGVDIATNATPRMYVDFSGNVGIGTMSPQSKFHLVGNGTSINISNIYNGDFVIQANSGGRNNTTGAQLEFAIPANTDGTNLWGQARIITVAGSTSSADATGKMILGTRRFYDKIGNGAQWYYGDDLIIDGAGNVGIGITYPSEKLSVNGNIRSKKLIVTQTGWSDYVFDSSYQLEPLTELEQFIKTNKHLPDVPSAKEVEKDGIDVGDCQELLLKKIEELTLYMIKMQKQMMRIEKINEMQEKENELLKQHIDKLENNR